METTKSKHVIHTSVKLIFSENSVADEESVVVVLFGFLLFLFFVLLFVLLLVRQRLSLRQREVRLEQEEQLIRGSNQQETAFS